MGIQVFGFLTPYMRSMTYVSLKNGHALLIDPCKLDAVCNLLESQNAIVDMAFLTHEHYDHISGLDWVQSQGIPVIATEACARNLADPKLNNSRYYGAFCAAKDSLKDDPIPEVKEYIGHADIIYEEVKPIVWQDENIILYPAPGHSDGSACIRIGNALFAGDVLFADLPANTRIIGGSRKKYMQQTIPLLKSFPPDITVYPGHGQSFPLLERLARDLDPT